MKWYCVIKQNLSEKKIEVLHIAENQDEAIVKIYESLKDYETNQTLSDYYVINVQSGELPRIEVYKKESSYISYRKELKYVYEVVIYEKEDEYYEEE